ncbi:hypothetical protein Tasa_017_121 [Tanticharoenia sakaeratensis NBRC 103193]|uniref:Zinc-ribbon domain-containing protein n=2 Tax=Tanticharoenia TaxID=444052 RepID=A0A0D6MLV0_9PROT|nr:hypothetical protein Tasa_017_121 [Tanticharoenia sakaeratensis NBRC 103193]
MAGLDPMKLFFCSACHQTAFFENDSCARCGHRLGYDPARRAIIALDPMEDGVTWRSVGAADAPDAARFCENAELDACNWLIPAADRHRFCLACRHNQTVPDLTDSGNLSRWRALERAKHRLFHTLLQLNLPITDRHEDPEHGLAFDFLADVPGRQKVMTGHDRGLITIALREADDVERERMRINMGEHYRTVLGHFRHEIGHYLWDLLVQRGGPLDECRALFGDDRKDYGAALKRHYDEGPPADWRENFISAYATMHPWEDFAETWAHYLHMIDALETAQSYGLRTDPHVPEPDLLRAHADVDPFRSADFHALAGVWLPMIYLLNSLNRSMGFRDAYPFVLTQPVLDKMAFMHRLVHAWSRTTPSDR